MIQIMVNYPIKKEKIFQDIKKEIFWYDFIKKEMTKFKGTNLRFKYQEDPFLVKMEEQERLKRGIKTIYRYLPEIENKQTYNIKEKIEKNKIENFFTTYLNYNNSNITVNYTDENSMFFNVPEKEVDDFSYQLERNNFNYNIG